MCAWSSCGSPNSCRKCAPPSASGAALQRKLAIETREVYAPLANRLGVWQVKWELEDLAFRYLEPAQYKHIAAALKVRRSERERYIEDLKSLLQARLRGAGIEAGHRGAAEAHLQHLAQDAGQTAGLRAADGHPRGAGAGEQRRRMLCGARRRALAVAIHPRRVRRLHRHARRTICTARSIPR